MRTVTPADDLIDRVADLEASFDDILARALCPRCSTPPPPPPRWPGDRWSRDDRPPHAAFCGAAS